MKEIEYQKKYIKEIVDTATKYLTDQDRESATIVFKAPTGSGKTYMVSQALTQMVKDNPDIAFAFIWISVNNLHAQSLNNLSKFFEDERKIECLRHDDLNNNTIEQNEIMFINWESINKENSLFRVDNEQNWNIQTVVDNTKDEGRIIVLLIDESHRAAKTEKSKEIIDIISPRLVIEITATPKPSSGTLIDIPLQAVIREGMIKKEIQINNAKQDSIKSNEDLLLAALRKRKQIQTAYQGLGVEINPLLLIQVPNKKAHDIIQPEDEIIEILSKQDISIQNGKLALWLSDDKRNKEDIEQNKSLVEVLIFKEAIALGWDCPRASILFLQREWNSERFEFNIQTLGRIMRMPEQKHYEERNDLNIGYVYTATNAFTVVEDLAKDYVSEQKLVIDNDIYGTPKILLSEHIRRKRELTRLSGDFKTVFFQAAEDYKLKDRINVNITRIRKNIKTDGHIIELDHSQEVEFKGTKEIYLGGGELQNSYDRFIQSSVHPYEISRSQNILKSTIRSWFKSIFKIDDEEMIQKIVLHTSENNAHFKRVIEDAKDLYGNLPYKQDEKISNENWDIPKEINLFTDVEKIEPSKKSIHKQDDVKCLLVRKGELSNPEKDFITELEKTDDYVLWWFKNGKSDAKYFSITYQKEDGHLYGFYPDFIINTKKELIIVEIKDDKDFKANNFYKLSAGRDYISRIKSQFTTYFFILSPDCYFEFFNRLSDMEIGAFDSIYEKRLIKFIKSQHMQISSKIESDEKLSKIEEEYHDLFSEYEKMLTLFQDEALKRELAEMRLEDAERILEQYKSNIEVLSKHILVKTETEVQKKLEIPLPFNICVLGEVVEESLIRSELHKYFQKLEVATTEWNVDFINNEKLRKTSVLKSLIAGQSHYTLIITGQIHSHSGKGNKSANLITELHKDKYIPHIQGCSPKEILTVDCLISAFDDHIKTKYKEIEV